MARQIKRAPKDNGRKPKTKVCQFCKDKTEWIDYKDVNLLRKFMSDRGKIRARRVSGNCAQHQRDIAVAIKTSRELALLPYSQRTVSERSGGGRGPRPDRRRPEAEGEDSTPTAAEQLGVDVGGPDEDAAADTSEEMAEA
jgi:small subunit ribosomal protein S18